MQHPLKNHTNSLILRIRSFINFIHLQHSPQFGVSFRCIHVYILSVTFATFIKASIVINISSFCPYSFLITSMIMTSHISFQLLHFSFNYSIYATPKSFLDSLSYRYKASWIPHFIAPCLYARHFTMIEIWISPFSTILSFVPFLFWVHAS